MCSWSLPLPLPLTLLQPGCARGPYPYPYPYPYCSPGVLVVAMIYIERLRRRVGAELLVS